MDGGQKRHPMMVVLKNRNLRLLWVGEALSVLGSQFYMIALPWLVLQLTGDPFKMGTVLALAGIPRALFMLVGGAFTDRFSAKTIIISSNAIRMTISLLLSALVLNSWATMPSLYALAFLFGLADAFLLPSQSAILPKIVESRLLLAANSIVQGTAHLSIAVGPALAGLVIALLSREPVSIGHGQEAADMFGIAVSFCINASAFFLSIVIISRIRLVISQQDQAEQGLQSVIAMLKQGLNYVKGDRALLYMLFVASVSHFLVEGPLLIGIPVLANSRFPEGAAAFGIIMSGLGAGMLIGIITAGTLPALKPKNMGQILVGLISLSGFGLLAVGLMTQTYLTALVVMLMGTAQGYVIVQFSTWIQVRTPELLLGRVLSMMMFASLGLVPVSQALCGALIKLSAPGLFIGAGITLTVINLVMMFTPEIRRLGLVTESGGNKETEGSPPQ